MPIIDPSDLVRRSFLRTEDDGQRLWVKIVKAIETYEDELNKNSARREIICCASIYYYDIITKHKTLLPDRHSKISKSVS